MAISGALEGRIIELERQIEWERKEKEELRAKYVSNLEEMERKHRKKIKEMKKEIMQQLRKQLKESNERVRALEGDLGEMKKLHQDGINDLQMEMKKMAARELHKQHRLLWISWVQLYQGRNIDGIRAKKGEAEEARWREFENTHYSPMYDNVLKRLMRDQVNIAHPTMEDDDDDDDDDEDSKVVAPERMQEIIVAVYKQRKNQSLRDTAVELVHSLDVLRRALGREDLLE